MPASAHPSPDLELCETYCAPNRVSSETVPLRDGVPEWIQLTPNRGEFQGRDGRRFNIPSPLKIVRSFNASAEHLQLDLDHESELGFSSRSSGWVTEMATRNAGQIWAKVEFTPEAANSLKNREFRGVSPVFRITPESMNAFREDGKTPMEVTEIVSVGLTNRPNLKLRSLNTRGQGQTEHQSNIMDEQLLEALNLGPDATMADALNAITKLRTPKQPDLDQFVPRADVDQLNRQLAEATAQIEAINTARHREKAELAVNAALRAGKIAPASVEYHLESCASEEGLARFAKYVETLPVIVSPNGEQARHAKPSETEVTALTDIELNMARQAGIDPEKMLAEKKRLASLRAQG